MTRGRKITAEVRRKTSPEVAVKRLLVGVDGSEASLHALRWATSFARPLHAELLVVSVLESAQTVFTYESELAERHELERRLGGWCAVVADAGVTYRSGVLDGDPAISLLAAADDDGADLVVVGYRGRGGFTGLWLGSVADYLAHHTTRPLAVISGQASSGLVERIVVGLDGSAGAHAAADLAADVSLATGADILAVHVFHPPLEWWPRTDERNLWSSTSSLLDGVWTAPLREAGAAHTTRMIDSRHTADAILIAADEEEAGLIVVGAHGLGTLRQARLGGVAMTLLHQSKCSLILVPPTADALAANLRSGDRPGT